MKIPRSLWLSFLFVGALVLLLSARSSNAATIYGCPDASGVAGNPSCNSEGSTCSSPGTMDHTAAVLISTWAGSTNVGGDPSPSCGAEGGEWVWRDPEAFEAGDLIYTDEVLQPPSFFGFEEGEDGGGDEETESPYPELTLEQAMGIAYAMLTLWVVCWIGNFFIKTVRGLGP